MEIKIKKNKSPYPADNSNNIIIPIIESHLSLGIKKAGRKADSNLNESTNWRGGR